MWTQDAILLVVVMTVGNVVTHPQYPAEPEYYQTTHPPPPQQNVYQPPNKGGYEQQTPEYVENFGGGPGDEIFFQEEKPIRQAVAVVKGPGNSGVQGVIYFQQKEPTVPVTISGYVEGLTPGWHGFHIHEFGDVSEDCKAAGGHYNPHGVVHGGPKDEFRHVGDLGNIASPPPSLYGYPQITEIYRQDNVISLFNNIRNIIGRAVVIHSGEDDLGKGTENPKESQKTGNAGSRVACGVIFLRQHHSG